MKAWKLIGGGIVLFAVAIAFLVRPEDELAGALRLKPDIAVIREFGPPNPLITCYRFAQSPGVVLAALPGTKGPYNPATEEKIDLPSGRRATLVSLGSTCYFDIVADNRPWFVRMWASVKHRVGL